MNHNAAEIELNNELPSCGVKQNPVISVPSGLICSEGVEITV